MPGPAPGDSAKTNLGHIHTRKPSLTSREIKEPDTADGFIFGKERAGAGFQGQTPASRWAEPRSVAGRGPSSAFFNLSGGVWPSSLGSFPPSVCPQRGRGGPPREGECSPLRPRGPPRLHSVRGGTPRRNQILTVRAVGASRRGREGRREVEIYLLGTSVRWKHKV